jgi:hypothetical protein
MLQWSPIIDTSFPLNIGICNFTYHIVWAADFQMPVCRNFMFTSAQEKNQKRKKRCCPAGVSESAAHVELKTLKRIPQCLFN